MITFGTEKIGPVVANHPIYADGEYIGNIEGPASSGRKVIWRVIVRGSKLGDYKNAEQAMNAVKALVKS